MHNLQTTSPKQRLQNNTEMLFSPSPPFFLCLYHLGNSSHSFKTLRLHVEFDCNLRLPFLLWWGIMLQHREPVFKLKFDSSTKQACGKKRKKMGRTGGGTQYCIFTERLSLLCLPLLFMWKGLLLHLSRCGMQSYSCFPLHLLHLVSLILYQLIYKIIYSMNNIKRLGVVTGLCAYLITIVWGLWGGWREGVDALYTVIKKK